MKYTAIKLKLLKQICRCDIYVGGKGNQNITSLKLCSIVDRMIDGIKVSASELNTVNIFWRNLLNLFDTCIDADDMKTFAIVQMPSSIDKEMFWKAYTMLKETYQLEDTMSTVADIKKRKKITINTTYGKYFNPFNQGQ